MRGNPRPAQGKVNAHWRGRSRKSGQRQTGKLTSTAESSGFYFDIFKKERNET
jgi:hypothetical protein